VKNHIPKVSGISSKSRIKTLIVDDSPLMLRILSQILEGTGGFDVVGSAVDGWQALRSVLALSPQLVVMDFHLPHLNGMQATAYIKAFKPPPVVVIVTSDANATSEANAKKAGADAFVAKGEELRPQLLDALYALFALGGTGGELASGFPCTISHEGQIARENSK
jgi:CheY-like chemotaxis protein